jgi:hypothetical protein
MSSDIPKPKEEPEIRVGEQAEEHPVRAAESRHSNGRAWRLWLGAILGAIAAATYAWLLGELGLTRTAAANAAIPTMGVTVMAPTFATVQAAEFKNAIRVFATFGAVLGLALALAGGWSRGNARYTWTAGALGLIAGGVAGAVGPLIVVPAYQRWRSQGADELIYSMGAHCGLLLLVGGVAGLALAVARGDRRRLVHAAMAGAIGALVGAIAYDLLGAFVLPFADTAEPLASTALARFLALLFPAIAIAAGAARGAGP